jgi:hypothetical protein
MSNPLPNVCVLGQATFHLNKILQHVLYNPTWGSVDVAYLALLAAISRPQRSDLGSQQGEKGVRARPHASPKVGDDRWGVPVLSMFRMPLSQTVRAASRNLVSQKATAQDS